MVSSLGHLPQSTAFVYSSPSTSSSVRLLIPSCSLKSNPNPSYSKHRLFHFDNRLKRRSFSPWLALDEVSVVAPLPSPPSELIASLKLKLVSTVSELNRGLAANEDDLQKADDAAKEIEAIGGPVDLSADLDKLQGRWKLLYSSSFSSRTPGGSRPEPPTGRMLPITLGQVFQRIDFVSKDLDNIVELEVGAPWPIPPFEVIATLAHKFELRGSAKIKITLEKTKVKTMGYLSQLPPLELPQIPDAWSPSSNSESGEFEVTYLDNDTRITRGDRGLGMAAAIQGFEVGQRDQLFIHNFVAQMNINFIEHLQIASMTQIQLLCLVFFILVKPN